MSIRGTMNRAGLVAGVVVPLALFGPRLVHMEPERMGLAAVLMLGTGVGVWALFRAVGWSIELAVRKK